MTIVCTTEQRDSIEGLKPLIDIDVPLSPDSSEPATHYGTNWVNADPATVAQLAALGCTCMDGEWDANLSALGLQRVNPVSQSNEH